MRRQDDEDKATHNEISEDIQQNEQKKSICPTPAIFEHPKFVKFWGIFKYVYVIGMIAFGFSLVFLSMIDPIGDWLDSQQRIVLKFLIHDDLIYIILVLILITLMKSIGMKDVLGLRTISVVVLAYRIVHNSIPGTLFMTMFIIGLLSSISKLIEYQVIGHELQVVQGTPVEFIFKYLRIVLEKCIDKNNLKWVDPKWTWEISEDSRKDKEMNILTNLTGVGHALQLHCKCCRTCTYNIDCDADIVQQQSNSSAKASDDEVAPRNYKHILCRIIYFIIAVIWTSVIEWVQPITELFLFAHNWDLSVVSVVIIILSEFCDFDKAVEAYFLIKELYSGGDIIDAKIDAVISKVGFWALGYCVVMPPTLLWAYFYHKKHFPDRHTAEEDVQMAVDDNGVAEKKNIVKNGTSSKHTA